MIDKELLEDLWSAVCDLCHWPYVYQDKDVMNAERCEYCPAVYIMKQMRKEAESCVTFRISNEAVIEALSKALLEGGRKP